MLGLVSLYLSMVRLECHRLKVGEPIKATECTSLVMCPLWLNYTRGGRRVSYVEVPVCALPDFHTMCGEDSDHAPDSCVPGSDARPDNVRSACS